jgi:transposase
VIVRKKKNKSGSISVQIIDKSSGDYKFIKTIGSSKDPLIIKKLIIDAQYEIERLLGLQRMNFDLDKEQDIVDIFFNRIEKLELMGPELLLGKIFDEIGFNAIKDRLFRYLVITRLVYPVSKLKTVDYLFKHKGLQYDVDKIYRYLDKLHKDQIEQIQTIGYQHTMKVLNNDISIVFYDVTTLYFEAEEEDDLRKTGFSKDGKHQNPQIVLGLLVSKGGYPIAYEIFEGNKYEGHTMLPVIETFKKKYELKKLIIVADAGLLSIENIKELCDNKYEFILGARIKNESEKIKEQVLNLHLKDGQSTVIKKKNKQRLIINYSNQRAKKDEYNRKRGLEKLEKALTSGKLSKKHINNRGYNKYLKLDGTVNVSIDYKKFEMDVKWDGLKGYLTNTKLTKEKVIEQYGQLWNIEHTFRISKTDIRIRPIFHFLKRRIESHICIAFAACLVYKELDRQLKKRKSELSPEKAINILKTIYSLTITTPYSNTKHTRLILKSDEQFQLLKLFDL